MLSAAEVTKLKRRVVVGLMSGTSLDGLDIALCCITSGPPVRCQLLAFETHDLPPTITAPLRVATPLDPLILSRLHHDYGRFCAAAVRAMCARHGVMPELVGLHGQTVAHDHGASTLQLGEPGYLAALLNCPVVNDFRANDLAVGGCGAPLVPYADHALLPHDAHGLIALNIGGITNITVLPPGADRADVTGFDCGPGNMVLDQLAAIATNGAQHADLDGAFAARGSVDESLLADLLDHAFIQAPPPKSAGREQFGAAYVEALLRRAPPQSDQAWYDLFATVTALSARAVTDAVRYHVSDFEHYRAIVVSGGGARNPQLLAALRRFAPNLAIETSDDYGLPVDAKEAMAFALLASERIDRRPTNLPRVTGGARPVLLGKITEL